MKKCMGLLRLVVANSYPLELENYAKNYLEKFVVSMLNHGIRIKKKRKITKNLDF